MSFVENEVSERSRLEQKVTALLPAKYHLCSGSISPRSMGSASLKYDSDNRVAWDSIWTSYCDLAMAGGPPHRGQILDAPTPEEVTNDPAGYQLVYLEIIRGIRMTTGLEATPGAIPGWVDVACEDEAMAGWLLRAAIAENVTCQQRQNYLMVPAGPTFRLVKEVKNVVVAVAKSCHYWCGHLTDSERAAAANLMASPPTLLQPALRANLHMGQQNYTILLQDARYRLQQELQLQVVASPVLGWIGIRLSSEEMAGWFVRALIAENVLARREQDVLFVPIPEDQSTTTWSDGVNRLQSVFACWQNR